MIVKNENDISDQTTKFNMIIEMTISGLYFCTLYICNYKFVVLLL